MFVSFNWIRDFVDLPADLDARALAEHFTVTTAEVEGVEQIECDASGLIAAEILAVEAIAGTTGQFAVKVNTGGGSARYRHHRAGSEGRRSGHLRSTGRCFFPASGLSASARSAVTPAPA